MKKYKKRILCLIGTAVVLGTGWQNQVSAAQKERTSEEYSVVCDVTDETFGADGTDRQMDTEALQKALNCAKNNPGKTLVQIPDGTYYIDNILYVYSNTDLVLGEHAKIVRTDLSKLMLLGAHVNEEGKFCVAENCTHGGYSQLQNVSITGGIWDGNVGDQTDVSTSSLISLSHGENISLKNMTLRNGSGYHLLVLDAVADAQIEQVTFADQRTYTGTEDFKYFEGKSPEVFSRIDQFTKEDWQIVLRFKEALHIDFTNEEGSTNPPLDDTICKNITVTGCTFTNVLGGVGDHHILDSGIVHENITISNNQFSGLKGNAIDALSMQNLKVNKNQVDQADTFLYAQNSTVESSDNVVTGAGMAVRCGKQVEMKLKSDHYTMEKTGHVANYAMIVNGGSKAQAADCTFTNGVNGGIFVDDNSTLDLTGSTIQKSGEKGGIGYRNAHGTVTDCSILDTAGEGVNLVGASDVELKNNEITGTKTGIHVMAESSNIRLENNRVTSADPVIVLEKSSGILTQNTVIQKDGTKNGIRIKENTGAVTVSQNNVTGAYNGISVGSGKDLQILENTISGSKNSGISISQSSKTEVRKNTVTDSESGVDIGFWGCSSGSCEENTVTQSETDNIKSDNDNVAIQNNQSKTPLKGWIFKNQAWYYYQNGKVLTGWQDLDGSRYYFNASGKMATGWISLENKWYYLKSSGKLCTGWFMEGKAWYYADQKGAIKTGWQKIGKNWYHFKSSGIMSKGWLQSGKNWYYLKASGELCTGWYQSDGSWYYANSDGVMKTGWQKIGKNWYFFKSNGKMCTGWLQSGKSWYYLKKSGELCTGWYQVDGSWYYANGDGVMQTGKQIIAGKEYVFASNGKWKA